MISVVEPSPIRGAGAEVDEHVRPPRVLELQKLVVEYRVSGKRIRAVDGVDLEIGQGEILGLAGESGCGKSTVANTVMQILRPPARITGGSIKFRGEDVTQMTEDRLRRYRWNEVSMVFQSAMNALNPVMRVGDQFLDMMRAHRRVSKREALARSGDLLELVGLERRRQIGRAHV